MSQPTFLRVASVLFFAIAIAHAVRLAFNVPVVVEGAPLPMWPSGLAAVVLSFLAVEGFRLSRR